ncbi:MAG: hypothetical protein GSR81_00605 [Desulfurococcales archaeon]|nr:hypothetical protein [Desulfurococcales archaeon]
MKSPQTESCIKISEELLLAKIIKYTVLVIGDVTGSKYTVDDSIRESQPVSHMDLANTP